MSNIFIIILSTLTVSFAIAYSVTLYRITKINQAFLYLQVNNETIAVEDIYKQFKGVKLGKELGLIEVYNQYNQRIKKLIGIEIKLVTYNKYLESMRHLASFIIWKYKSKEIMLKIKI